MAYIYQADIYCDDCGQAICERLQSEGKAPLDISNEYSYDSDDYPKYADDDSESDTPQHCGSHEHCFNAITLPSGRKVGYLFGELTRDGVEYVKEYLAQGDEPSEVSLLWESHFADYLEMITCDHCGDRMAKESARYHNFIPDTYYCADCAAFAKSRDEQCSSR